MKKLHFNAINLLTHAQLLDVTVRDEAAFSPTIRTAYSLSLACLYPIRGMATAWNDLRIVGSKHQEGIK